MTNVEARRNCFQAIPKIMTRVAHDLAQRWWRPLHRACIRSTYTFSLDLSAEVVRALFDALDSGLDDYTTDERGDVGSWIRIACIQGLASIIVDLFRVSASLPHFSDFLPAQRYHHVVGRILRQGVERLDNVRQIAGESFIRILCLSPPSVDDSENWRVRGETLMRELFLP